MTFWRNAFILICALFPICHESAAQAFPQPDSNLLPSFFGREFGVFGAEPEEVLTVPWSQTALQPDRSYRPQNLTFEQNDGQTDSEVKYLARGPGYTLFLTGHEAVMTLYSTNSSNRREEALTNISPQGLDQFTSPSPDPENLLLQVVRTRLVGANPRPSLAGEERLRGKVNYFIGNDPALWRTNIPTFARVRYQEVYPGIDLVYYGNDGQLEYDFIVAPGADPNCIALEMDGADEVEVNDGGDLVMKIGASTLVWRKPLIYQEANGLRQAIPGNYLLMGSNAAGNVHRIRFELAPYNRALALVIDPVLVWGTFLGGSSINGGFMGYMALDKINNAYIAGITTATDFPTKNPFQASLVERVNAFVTKLDANGEIAYSTYVGPITTPGALGRIAVDSAGSAFVVGATTSRLFPLVNAFQPDFGGGANWGDSFVAKLSPEGSALIYSTYLGGSGEDFAAAVSVDAAGNAYVTGQTSSSNFPTANAFQSEYGGGNYDAFLVKLNPTGSALLYSTYLGGTAEEIGFNSIGGDIAVDDQGSAYVVGGTSSPDFPMQSPFQQSLTGNRNGFFTKFNPAGNSLVFSSYLGGSGPGDAIRRIVLGSDGDLYLAGVTSSWDFPTAGAFQANLLGESDGFVARYRPSLNKLMFSTYFGGSDYESMYALAVDAVGKVYFGGITRSPDFPTTVDALQPQANIFYGSHGRPITSLGFLSVLDPDGSKIVYSSYLGGKATEDVPARDDQVRSLVLDSNGSVYVSGNTSSVDFPIQDAILPKRNKQGEYAVFIAKFTFFETLPALTIIRSEQTLLITWPDSVVAVLEMADVLPATTWVPVPTDPVQIGDQQAVTFEIGAQNKFFRLRTP